jgi:hypothetical protein
MSGRWVRVGQSVLVLSIWPLQSGWPGADVPAPTDQRVSAARKIAALGRTLAFEPLPTASGFHGRAAGHSVLLSGSETVLMVPDTDSGGHRAQRVHLRLRGADPGAVLVPEGPLPGRVNYFIGDDPANWRTDVSTFARVRKRDVYPGIDQVFYGRGERLEYDFVVAPGVDPSIIGIEFGDALKSRVDASGDLVVETAAGPLRLLAPVMYQDEPGGRRQIAGRYVYRNDGAVGFAIGDYDGSRVLVIDPVLVWATYLGSPGQDNVRDITVDGAGSIYVTGQAGKYLFPVEGGLPFGAGAFLTKLTPDGDVVFSTYFGAISSDRGNAVAVDADGFVYVSGLTQGAFPLVSPFDPLGGGPADGFAVKFTPEGNGLVYSTYLGGTEWDESRGIAVDAGGNAWIVGGSRSTDFPTLAAIKPTKPAPGTGFDAFITKLSATGAGVFSTYWGGSTSDTVARGVALNASGEGIVVGDTNSATFPTVNAYDSTVQGTDVFVSRFASDGASLLYSTVIGGSNTENYPDVALGPNGHVFLVGVTWSSDFPVVNGYQEVLKGANDMFVAKLNLDGTSLEFSTFLGGSRWEHSERSSIVVDSLDRAVIAGQSESQDFPMVDPMQSMSAAGEDVQGFPPGFVISVSPVLAKFATTGSSLVHSTWVGGVFTDRGAGAQALALDNEGKLYLGGWIWETGLLTTADSLQPENLGVTSGFVLRVDDGSGPCTYAVIPGGGVVSSLGASGTVTVDVRSSGCAWSAGSNVPWVAITGGSAGTGAGRVAYTVEANPGAERVGTISVNGAVFGVTQLGTPQPGCGFQVLPAHFVVLASGGAGQFAMTPTLPTCTWTAMSLDSWILLTGATGGTGNGIVDFSVAENPGINPRRGLIRIGTLEVPVAQRGRNLILDGTFDEYLLGRHWLTFATPSLSYIDDDLSCALSVVTGEGIVCLNWALRFNRVPPPPGTSNQAVVFQPTNAPVPQGKGLRSTFKLANTSSSRRRVSVLIHDGNFQDLSVCTFWLMPFSSLSTFEMQTHTTVPWTNATISFYAATAGTSGSYLLDDVTLDLNDTVMADRTVCVDPAAPDPPGGAESPELLSNGDFSAGLPPWGLFGQILQQLVDGVFEFYRPAGSPAGVVLQGSGDSMSASAVMRARFDLGNSSGVRKRVTVLLHDADFSDLSACTFWLPPGQPLLPYEMRTYATKSWSNATLSVYPATIGTDQWIRLDNVSLQRFPSMAIAGTECVEPSADFLVGNRGSR